MKEHSVTNVALVGFSSKVIVRHVVKAQQAARCHTFMLVPTINYTYRTDVIQ